HKAKPGAIFGAVRIFPASGRFLLDRPRAPLAKTLGRVRRDVNVIRRRGCAPSSAIRLRRSRYFGSLTLPVTANLSARPPAPSPARRREPDSAARPGARARAPGRRGAEIRDARRREPRPPPAAAAIAADRAMIAASPGH